jgi:hypothetical protein
MITIFAQDQLFRYNGVNKHGTRIMGVTNAPSLEAAREELERYYETVVVFPAGLGEKPAELRSTAGKVRTGDAFTSGGAVSAAALQHRFQKPKEKFSFTKPDVPLFGPEYQKTKERSNQAMENLRKAVPGKDDLDSDKRRLQRLEKDIDEEKDFDVNEYRTAAQLKHSIKEQQGHDDAKDDDMPKGTGEMSEYSQFRPDEATKMANATGRAVAVFSNGRIAPVDSPVAKQLEHGGATITKTVKPGAKDIFRPGGSVMTVGWNSPEHRELKAKGWVEADIQHLGHLGGGGHTGVVMQAPKDPTEGKKLNLRVPQDDNTRTEEMDPVGFGKRAPGRTTRQVGSVTIHSPIQATKKTFGERGELGTKHSSNAKDAIYEPAHASTRSEIAELVAKLRQAKTPQEHKTIQAQIDRINSAHESKGGHFAVRDSAMDAAPSNFDIVNRIGPYLILEGMAADSGSWFIRHPTITRRFETQRDAVDYANELAMDAMEGIKQKLAAAKQKLVAANKLSPEEAARLRKAVEEYEKQLGTDAEEKKEFEPPSLERQKAAYKEYQDEEANKKAKDQGGFAMDPPVSEAQRKAMGAAKSGNSTLGIPASVGKEFIDADKGGKLPSKK